MNTKWEEEILYPQEPATPQKAKEWFTQSEIGFIQVQIIKVQQEIAEQIIDEIKLPEYDHTKCPIKETCIGYQNAESDLENRVIPQLKSRWLSKGKEQ